MRFRLLEAIVVGLAAAAVLPPGGQVRGGVEPSALDASIRPQDDLYGHVNAGWLARTPIPPDFVSYNAFTETGDRVEADVLAIIREVRARPDRPKGSPSQKIADMFASVTDEAGIEARGGAPLADVLGRIARVRTPRDLAAEAGRLSSIAAAGPFNGALVSDPRDPSRVIAQIAQGGTLLPERRFYFETDARAVEMRARYARYLSTLFGLIERPRPEADAAAVIALETELARAQWTPEESRDSSRTPGRFTFGELATEMPGFDWAAWGGPQGLTAAGAVVLMQPSFFKSFAALVPAVPLETWRLWLAARYITYASPYVSDAFGNARFEFFGHFLTGQEAPRPRWKRGVGMVTGYLGDAIGRLYVEKHFPDASKRRVETLVTAVRSAFRDAIAGSAWLSPPARRAALDKLGALRVRVGRPDAWRDYRDLDVTPDDLLGNVLRAQQFDNRARLARSSGREDPRHWPVTAQSVNAFYSPHTNEIVLPAGLLQPPFFDPEADDAINYGAVGGIVGHELAHGFDLRGRRIDARGQERDWWRPEDERAYVHRVSGLVAQFDGYTAADGSAVDGRFTLIENAADLAGLTVAFRAYRASLGGRPSPAIDGLSGEQRFFIGWARVWRARLRPEYVRQALLTDPHAPAAFRVNGTIGNLPEFYDAFGVRPGDRLFRPADQRVALW